ncbi:MAG TPA: DNA-formamidopyrimidine glycosylase family protein [Deinococcales bacterium]|nr:DNA-formamidopyrimidine glycosylase family protein [Deinococcales bacterium]
MAAWPATATSICTNGSAWTAPSSGAPCTKGRSRIPELPEVETVRRELAPWLAGRPVLGARLEEAEPGPKYRGLDRLTGQVIRAVERRGKFLVLPLERNGERLGLDGAIVGRALYEGTVTYPRTA